MGESAVVDLVCGPASPLAETFQRYRLVARLGAGGQADVYRGVRLCGGVTSTAVTVKVFRINPKRSLADELRSWDKGDAALMDLNTRGVPGICRRVDGFYGEPPHVVGAAHAKDAVPYQVYDYLHGVNLREYVAAKAGFGAQSRLNATNALLSLADALKALHEPDNITLCPVLHMDVKPSNIMVLTNGDTRLIDFTGARYWRSAEITQIAYTPESGGPEALHGEVGPAYDVHGFGAVAFYLVSGVAPRGNGAPPLAQHEVFAGRPALRDHLLAVLADRPQDRPSTFELTAWTQRLAQLVRASQIPDMGLDWSDRQALAAPQRAVGRARAALTGTETDAFMRIEALERELVALRARVGARPSDGAPAPAAVYVAPTSPASPNGVAAANGAVAAGGAMAAGGALAAAIAGGVGVGNGHGSARPASSPPAAGSRAGSAGAVSPAGAISPAGGVPAGGSVSPAGAGSGANGSSGPGSALAPASAMVGRAAVVRPAVASNSESGSYPAEPAVPGARVSHRTGANMRKLRRGGGWTVAGLSFAVVCWLVWTAAHRKTGAALAPGYLFATLGVALGVFIVLRLLGRLVIEGWMHKTRRGARGAHLGTAAFLFAVGVTYLQDTSWIMDAYRWAKGL